MIDLFGWWRRQIAAATIAGVGDAVRQMTAGTEADDAKVAAVLGVAIGATLAPPALSAKADTTTPEVATSTNGTARRKASVN